MVDKYRKYLIEDPNRPFSWEECEAPEVLPRTLVDTTIQQLVRLLPAPLRRVPAASWGDHFGEFITTLAHIFLRSLRRRLYFFGENFLARIPWSCSSSWTTLRPNTSSGLYIRPSTPLFTTALEFPCAASLRMASFDQALGRPQGIRTSFPAWASAVAAAILVTIIPPTNGSTRTLHIS